MKRFMKGSLSTIVIILLSIFALMEAAADRIATPCGPVVTKADFLLKAMVIGPGPLVTIKSGILQEATRFVQGEGFDLKLDIAAFATQNTENYRRSFALTYAMGSGPDILSEDQEMLPEYAEKGILLPLDIYVKADAWKADFADFSPELWDAVSWNGKIYGVPLEQVVSCVYYHKDVLRKLGMSYAEIETTFSPENPNFTLEGLIELSRQAKAAGLVEWGFTHRPDNGDYWLNTVMIFGGEVVDPVTSNIVIDTEALRKDFAFHKRLVDEELIPEDMTAWDWQKIHQYTVEGKTLFWLGGHSGQRREYQHEAYRNTLGVLSDDDLERILGIAPFPGMTGPVTPIKVHAYTITSTTKYPDLALNILTKAVKPKSIIWHSRASYTGPVRISATEDREFKNNKYLARVLDLMQYARLYPNHPAMNTYKNILFETITGIEAGRFAVEQAIEFMVTKAKSDIPGAIIK